MKFRTAYDGLNDEVSLESGIVNDVPTRTQQSQAADTDINLMLKKFRVTGLLPQGIRVPTFEDFTESVSDFRTAMDMIVAAEKAFLAMPSDLRKRLDNDPQKFLEWCADEANGDEARKYGLLMPVVEKPPEVVQKVEIVNPTPPAA